MKQRAVIQLQGQAPYQDELPALAVPERTPADNTAAAQVPAQLPGTELAALLEPAAQEL
jgi:hypothetical protein